MTPSIAMPEPGLDLPSLTPAKAARRVVRSIVVLGVNPSTLAFARRVAGCGVQLHLVELTDRPGSFRHPRHYFEQDGIALDRSQIGNETALNILKEFAIKVNADALLTSDDCALA